MFDEELLATRPALPAYLGELIPIWGQMRVRAWALVDHEYAERINLEEWHLSNGYAKNREGQGMHRIIWQLAHGTDVPDVIDHIDRIKLDNRKINLREVTHKENGQNSRRGESRSLHDLPALLKNEAHIAEIALMIPGPKPAETRTERKLAWQMLTANQERIRLKHKRKFIDI